MKTRRDEDGELFAMFHCGLGHEFEVGPIHNPDASAHEVDPDNPGTPDLDPDDPLYVAPLVRSTPGSGDEEHVPTTYPCRVCFVENGRSDVTAIPVP